MICAHVAVENVFQIHENSHTHPITESDFIFYANVPIEFQLKALAGVRRQTVRRQTSDFIQIHNIFIIPARDVSLSCIMPHGK